MLSRGRVTDFSRGDSNCLTWVEVIVSEAHCQRFTKDRCQKSFSFLMLHSDDCRGD